MSLERALSKPKNGSRPPWAENTRNPFNWSLKRKWFITLLAAWVSFSVGLNATSILSAASALGQEFGFSDDNFPTSYWTVTSWTMGAAIGPMIGMPLLEEFGVRKGYLICYTSFMIFFIPQAVAKSLATLIVTRTFAGFFAGILMNGLEAIIADMFATDVERSLPVAFFILVYSAGFTLGPAYGAIWPADQWRWMFYTHLIVFAVFFPVLWFGLLETRGHLVRALLPPQEEYTLSTQDPEALAETHDIEDASTQCEERAPLLALFYEAVIRPAVLLGTQPVVLVFTFWSAFATALVFISTESINTVYGTNFGFNERQVGVVQAAMFVGEILGFLFCLPQNAYYLRSARWNKETPGAPVPEARLMLAIPASFVGLAGGLFWYAWSSGPGLSWVMPSVGMALVGFGMVVVINSAVGYLTDAYTSVAGSAVAALALGENLFSAWVPLATPKMYRVLGVHWAGSLLAFVAVALSFVPVVLTIYGRRIRNKSSLMDGK